MGAGGRGAVKLGEGGYGVWGEAGGAAETRQGRIMVALLPNVREVDLIWRTVGSPGKQRRDVDGRALSRPRVWVEGPEAGDPVRLL